MWLVPVARSLHRSGSTVGGMSAWRRRVTSLHRYRANHHSADISSLPIRTSLIFKNSSPFHVSLPSGIFGYTPLEQIWVTMRVCVRTIINEKESTVVRVSGVHDAGTASKSGIVLNGDVKVRCSICQGSSTDQMATKECEASMRESLCSVTSVRTIAVGCIGRIIHRVQVSDRRSRSLGLIHRNGHFDKLGLMD